MYIFAYFHLYLLSTRIFFQVYLVDMGLACKYLRDGVHKKEMPDPKKAHNGTPEFTSRDAHRGCMYISNLFL